MSKQLEHDYIGLSEVSSMEGSQKLTSVSEGSNGLNLKATELRLGLPGSESPERIDSVGGLDQNGYPLGVLKNLVSGAKRGFSDAIDGGSGKWVFAGSGGSETDVAKGGGLFSPRGGNGGGKLLGGSESSNQHSGLGTTVKNDVVPPSPKPMHEKKPQVAAPAAK